MSDFEIKTRITADKPLVLPFQITHEQASARFMHSFSRNKLIPTEFYEAAHSGKAQAVFFPACLFNCEMQTDITAACTKRDGDTVLQYEATRSVKSAFADLLMPSGDNADDTLLRLLEPYDLEQSEKFSDDLTKETTCEKPTAEPAKLFEAFKPMLESEALTQAKQALHEYTNSEITSCIHSYPNIEAAHILLPMWLLPVNYRGRDCFIFMNGQTGKIAGIPPKSIKKIIALIGAAAAIGAGIAELIWLAVTML